MLHEFFQKKIFIILVTVAIMPKHNFPNIVRGDHDNEGSAHLNYKNQNNLCSLHLYAVREQRILQNKFFFENYDRFSKKFEF